MRNYIIKQEDEADCGACCLYSIIKYYNGFVPLEVIKVDTLTTNEGTSFFNLKEAGVKYGFEVSGEKVKTLSSKKIPYIVQLKISNSIYHFVVVYKMLEDKVICMDPSSGIKKYTLDEFYKLFTGYVLYFTPLNKIKFYHKNHYFIHLLYSLIKSNLLKLLFILFMSIVIVIASLFSAYILKEIINSNYKFIYYIFVILGLRNILNYIKGYLLAHLNKTNSIILIYDYIRHFFLLPYKYLQLKSAGEIVSRISDLNNLKDFISKEIINLFISVLFIVCSLVIIFVMNKVLAMILLFISIINFMILYFINKKSFNLYLNNLDSESDFNNTVIEYIDKIKVIKNLNKINYFLDKLNKKLNIKSENNYNLNKFLNINNFLINIFSDLGLIIVMMISFIFKESAQNIFLYIMYYNYYTENINYIISLLPYFMYFKGLFVKVNNLYYLDKENVKNGLKFKNGDITISNLKYNINLNIIFDKFNININKGDKVLLIGNNGSGKSTLLNILNNNITDYEGHILIDNLDIKDINKVSLKENICYSAQDDDLFIDTILNNIILDKPFDNDKLKLIDKVLDLKSIIKNKVNGYNTLIKDNLSGGERQRIILARCLYQDYNILLLDESLSEVSHYLRLKIINNINYYFKDKTIIYVSHFYEKYPFDKIINLTARKEKQC